MKRVGGGGKWLRVAALLAVCLGAGETQAQRFERWFQVEVTIFSNESSADRERETWPANPPPPIQPENTIRLRRIADSLFLDSYAFDPEPASAAADRAPGGDFAPVPAAADSGFRLPDPQRDPFLRLSDAVSDFRQTNQALARSPQHRVLFHAVWRQPIGDPGSAVPIAVGGGDEGGAEELRGWLALNFNANRDRVIFQADLRLTDYAAGSRTYAMRQQRELRSGEFHYLDHPAIGVVVQIVPYETTP